MQKDERVKPLDLERSFRFQYHRSADMYSAEVESQADQNERFGPGYLRKDKDSILEHISIAKFLGKRLVKAVRP